MAAEPQQPQPEPRGFWSGTITFGLVSVPVDLYPAVRPRRVALRMLGEQGQPLQRRYFCSADGKALSRDEIVRGYPWDDGSFTVVTDEELEAVTPRKSRDIELKRFVNRKEIEPRLLERPYLLAPAGDSTKAYHLLAETMQRTDRAGIATFVMRGKEYLAAIFAEGGLLRAATMRFIEELRTPHDVGLPEAERAPAKSRQRMEAALKSLAAEALDESLLRDDDADRIRELAERKRAESRDVVEVSEVPPEDEEEAGEVVDIMSVLKRRVGADGGSRGNQPRGEQQRGGARSGRGSGRRRSGSTRDGSDSEGGRRPPKRHDEGLENQSKQALYERAKALDVPGRSRMSRDQLLDAIREAG